MAGFSCPIYRFHDHSLVYGARREQTDESIARLSNGLSEDAEEFNWECDGQNGEVADDRVGMPFLITLPLRARPLDPYVDPNFIKLWTGSLKNDIRTLMKENDFPFHDISFGKYEPKFRHSESPIETIIIRVFRKRKEGEKPRPGPDPSWLPMCKQIFETYIHYKVSGAFVEIRDVESPLFIETKPLRCHEAIIPFWPAVRERCLLHMRDRDELISFGCYRRGRLPGLELVTIVITVALTSHELQPWRDIRDRILKDLKEFKLLDVAVEVIAEEGSLDEFCWHPGCVCRDDVATEARLGRSLGVRHNYDRPFLTGTLGGFLTLTYHDLSVRTFAMTCYHCVEDSRPTNENRLTWNMFGIRPDEAGDSIEVLQPAQVDIERWKEHLRLEIEKHTTSKNWNRDIPVAEGPKKERESQLVPDPVKWEPSKTQAELERELQFVEITTRIKPASKGTDDGLCLGRVYAASGIRINPESTTPLDWALIDFAPFREPRSRAASVVPEHVRQASNLPPPLPSQIKGYRAPLPGEPVFKLGRSSGLTSGVVNPIPETVRSTHSARKQDYGEQTVVIGTNPDHEAFSKRGDSGAWVISTKGEYLGHIIAGKRRMCATLITLATETIEDVKELTGAPVADADVGAVWWGEQKRK